MRAWEEFEASGPPPYEVLEITGSSLTPPEVDVAMSKLRVMLRGMEELLKLVAMDRAKIRVLVNQILDATRCLEEIGVVWRVDRALGGERGRERERDKDRDGDRDRESDRDRDRGRGHHGEHRARD